MRNSFKNLSKLSILKVLFFIKSSYIIKFAAERELGNQLRLKEKNSINFIESVCLKERKI